MPPPVLAVSCAAPELLAQADAHLPLLLHLSGAGLELRKPDDPRLTGSIRVDFTSGAVDFRRRQTGKELLLKAVGCKGSVRPAVIDATGGLGRDSFLLAAAGCEVHLFEREPVIAALLADGIERARRHPETAAIAARMRLTVGDALPFLRTMRAQGQLVDTVYLDPMFPERRKAALVKKELQFLQLLADPDPAAEKALLDAARAVSHRVAVKRPAKAPFLANQPPSHSLYGKNARFDAYFFWVIAFKFLIVSKIISIQTLKLLMPSAFFCLDGNQNFSISFIRRQEKQPAREIFGRLLRFF